MTDTSQGPGWSQASDGRWYPPGAHLDAEPSPAVLDYMLKHSDDPVGPDDQQRQFPNGLLAVVRPVRRPDQDPTHWHWVMEKDDELWASGWAESRSDAERIVDELGPHFPGTTPPSGTELDTASQLEQVAKLHERGLLGDDEFAKAKRLILSPPGSP
ncbi:MAG: hypothetical protein ACLP5O_13795 [Acidimicrobiales bacterium]